LEGTLKKLALVASAATVLICAASLVATPADAKKTKRHAAAAPAGQMAGGPGGYNAGPSHAPGGPVKSGGMCWKDKDPWANTGQGYWGKC
jgi:hypothetical protein